MAGSSSLLQVIDLPLHVMSGLFNLLFFAVVFQAGDKHYHPSCARCSRCNQMFTEGEEMYLQGEWTQIYFGGPLGKLQEHTNIRNEIEDGTESLNVHLTHLDFWQKLQHICHGYDCPINLLVSLIYLSLSISKMEFLYNKPLVSIDMYPQF